MKIIGKTAEGLLLSATESDIAHLVGFYSQYNERRIPQVGDDINLHAMFHQLYDLASKRGELEKTATQLESIAALLRATDPVISQLATEAAQLQGRQP